MSNLDITIGLIVVVWALGLTVLMVLGHRYNWF